MLDPVVRFQPPRGWSPSPRAGQDRRRYHWFTSQPRRGASASPRVIRFVIPNFDRLCIVSGHPADPPRRCPPPRPPFPFNQCPRNRPRSPASIPPSFSRAFRPRPPPLPETRRREPDTLHQKPNVTRYGVKPRRGFHSQPCSPRGWPSSAAGEGSRRLNRMSASPSDSLQLAARPSYALAPLARDCRRAGLGC